MIKNIIFDMGGVLIDWNPNKLIEDIGIDNNDHDLVYCELFKEVEWVALDAGTISFAEAINSVNSRLPERVHDKVARLIDNWWNIYFKPIDGMKDTIRSLKENGYNIYLLSNASIAQKDYFHKIEGYEYFDGRVTSSEIKLLKPYMEIYKHICEKYNLIPEECFFVDDSSTNIYHALEFGFKGCVFDGVEEFKKELRKEEIKI